MSNSPDDSSTKSCASCGQPLRAGARFCDNCGARVVEVQAAQPPPDTISPGASASQTSEDIHAIENDVPPSPTTAQPSHADQQPTYQLVLQAVAPMARARVINTLRQKLGLDPRSAQAYIGAAPVVLAVGLKPDVAEALRQALVTAGAVVAVQELPPPRPQQPPAPEEPPPDPIRRLDLKSKTFQVLAFRPGWRTVTGLDLGSTFSYLAYARADGQQLVTQADLVRFDARVAVPTAIQPAQEGRGRAFGAAALEEWIKQPEAVFVGFVDQFGQNSDEIAPILRNFAEILARRMTEVSGPGALAAAEGASTTLGVPAGWDQESGDLLKDVITQSGFPVNRIVPQPLAALAHHLQQGALRQGNKTQKTMVIDWGGTGLRISFVEYGGPLSKPQLFEHIEWPLGGYWFDNALLEKLASQLPPELGNEDQRALTLFVRDFKEEMSRSFAEGKNEYAQYCVIPAGVPPTRVRMARKEFEELTAEARSEFQNALIEAVKTIGLEPKHIDNVILAGGSARWYFAREAIRTTLNRVPLIGSHPEQSIARGLAVYGLTFQS